MLRSSRIAIGVLSFLLLLFLLPTRAQLPTGTILGLVKDSSGAAVPGTTVTITNTETGQTRTVTTGDDGAYRVPALAVGKYEVKAEHSGFSTETQTGLALDVSQELVANFTLQVGTTQQQVVVTGEAPIVNTSSSSLGGLVNEDKLSDLPLNGRNYIDLTIMQSGVTTDATVGHLGGVSGTWFSSNGAPPRSNYFTLDGAPLWNGLGGSSSSASGTTLGVDGIKEYKIITNAFSAEYGMTMGSQVVMVSKGGGNQFHGDAFEYLRNSALDARNYFDPAQIPEFRRNNFGGSLGGPIKRDKTFFFGVYEGLRQSLGVTTVDNVIPGACHTEAHSASGLIDSACVPGLAAPFVVNPVMAPLLDLYPIPNVGVSQYRFPSTNPINVNYGQGRIDHNFSPSDSLFGRYTIDKSYEIDTTIINAAGNPAYPQFRASDRGQNQFVTISENHIFSASLLNTARFSFSRTDILTNNLYPFGVASLTGPTLSFITGLPVGDIAIGGIAQIGPSGNYPTYQAQNYYTLSDDLYYTRDKHALKFGFLANRINNAINAAAGAYGTLNFAGVSQFLKGTYVSESALTPGGNESRYYGYYTYGFYAQDDYRAFSRVTLNLGLRYEFQTVPRELEGHEYAFRHFPTDTAPTQGAIMRNPSLLNFSPRVGFAWDVRGNGKTSVRSAFGIYYDMGNWGQVLAQQEQALPPLATNSALTNGTLTSLPFVFPASALGKTLHTMNYNIGQPHAMQYNLTVEQQLPFGVGLSVSYVGLRATHLFHQEEGNYIPDSSFVNGLPVWDPYVCAGALSTRNTGGCAANPAYVRINPNWGSNVWLNTGGNSWYNSLQVNVNKRLSKGLELQGTYTWGKSLDTTEGVAFNNDCLTVGSDHGTYFPNTGLYDKGPSCFDIGQTLHANLLYHFPTVNSTGLTAKLLNGWWMGSIVTVESGYPFSPVISTQRDESGNIAASAASAVDRVNVNTAASIAASGPCTSQPGQPAAGANPCAYTPIPFNKSSVNTGNPAHWFNPAMFSLEPLGTLGNASRDMLRGPGLGTWDFSLVKDTALPFLGEAGNLEFRAELFNMLNRSNFGLPSTPTFTGTLTDLGPYSELPIASYGSITNTSTTSRQIQFALKIIF